MRKAMRIAVIPMMLAAAVAAADCTVTLPEDDYHRIKGLLKGSREITHRYVEQQQVLLRVVFADTDRFTEQLNRRTLERYGNLQCIRKEKPDAVQTTPHAAAPTALEPAYLKLDGRAGQ